MKCNFHCFFLEVAMEFRDSSYNVDENAGEVEIELTLDGAIECCSISVTLIVKDGTAKGKLLTLISSTQV